MTTDNEHILLITSSKHQRRLEIMDREDPELYRAIFPYSEVPRITFDGNEPSLAPARELLITDTTFRDGQQARPPYSVAEIVRIFQFLSRLGGPEGVIRKSEFFLYSEKDRQAVDACRELGLAF
ncbi:MAG: histone-lysine N-methyltransferase, partial [Candidatus Adiutrix sp.]|nr:histone-lysine N-methyltransferase [Candidatus Adiutrix sp.]